MTTLIENEPIVIIISKEEILSGNVAGTVTLLKRLIETPNIARQHMEKLDIAVDGYNNDQRELFEIHEVREYLLKLNRQFPYWLFFLSKHYLGLQLFAWCVLYDLIKISSLMSEEHRKQNMEAGIRALKIKWFPPMEEMGSFVHLTDLEIQDLKTRSLRYFKEGRIKIS